MDSNTFSTKVAAATTISAHASNRNLSTDPNRMAMIKAWDALFRGARKYVESKYFLAVHNMPHIVGVTGACENTNTLFTTDWYDGKKMFLPQSNQPYIKMLTQKVESGCAYGEIQSFRKKLKADDCRLAQFSLFEIEYLGGLDELIGHLSAIAASAVKQVSQDCAKELALFGRVAQFLFGQTDIRDCVPFLINRENVI